MQVRATRVVMLVVAVAAALTTVAVAGDRARHADPRQAAKALVARLRAERRSAQRTVGSGVAIRSGRRWFAVASAFGSTYASPTRVDVYTWSGADWKHEATVRGDGLSNLITLRAVSLTASRDPDFAIQGCGAADTNCLSVVSDAGGRWRALPFEYGYGRSVDVNGVPQGHLVLTAVDACGCAGGPSTWTYEAYRDGRFQPVDPPGRRAECSARALGHAAGNGEVPLLQFDRVACAGGWALGVGTGAGYTGQVVGLFNGVPPGAHGTWRALTVDNGSSLTAAPGIYDLPLSLLEQLSTRLGPTLRPMVDAARLIARLQRGHEFVWPQQNAIVRTADGYWLVAVLPARTPHKRDPPYLVRADIYRWSGGRWRLDGHVPRLPASFDLPWSGGWIVAVPGRDPAATAFARAGSGSGQFQGRRSRSVITNAGGTWHVAAGG